MTRAIIGDLRAVLKPRIRARPAHPVEGGTNSVQDPIYRLVLRPDAAHSAPAPREPMREHLARIPGITDRGDGLHTFGDPDDHGVMEIELLVLRDGERVPVDALGADEAGQCNGIEVRVPRAWVMPRGPQVFALIFMMAEWNGWEVFDPQIDDTLQKEAVLSGLVAMRQQQLEAEGRGGPAGTRAHFVTPDPRGVGVERPPRPEGVKMAPPPPPAAEDPVRPNRPGPAATAPSPKKPWWKRWSPE